MSQSVMQLFNKAAACSCIRLRTVDVRGVSYCERQLLDVSDGGELLHAGQDSFDSALGGKGNPPLVFEH